MVAGANSCNGRGPFTSTKGNHSHQHNPHRNPHLNYYPLLFTFNHHFIQLTMITFWILWIFNALMALIPVFFFFIGLGDGSVNGENMGLWMIILTVIGLIIGGTYWLKTRNQLAAAKVILIIASIPSLIAILYAAMFMFSDVRWN
jgi:hypothetical protein